MIFERFLFVLSLFFLLISSFSFFYNDAIASPCILLHSSFVSLYIFDVLSAGIIALFDCWFNLYLILTSFLTGCVLFEIYDFSISQLRIHRRLIFGNVVRCSTLRP